MVEALFCPQFYFDRLVVALVFYCKVEELEKGQGAVNGIWLKLVELFLIYDRLLYPIYWFCSQKNFFFWFLSRFEPICLKWVIYDIIQTTWYPIFPPSLSDIDVAIYAIWRRRHAHFSKILESWNPLAPPYDKFSFYRLNKAYSNKYATNGVLEQNWRQLGSKNISYRVATFLRKKTKKIKHFSPIKFWL